MGIKPIPILRQIVAGHLLRATKNPIAGLTFYQNLVTGGRLEQSLRPSTSLDHAPRRIQTSLPRINSLEASPLNQCNHNSAPAHSIFAENKMAQTASALISNWRLPTLPFPASTLELAPV